MYLALMLVDSYTRPAESIHWYVIMLSNEATDGLFSLALAALEVESIYARGS